MTAISFPPSLSSSPSPVKGRTVQILVVDDSIVQRKMCRVLLAGKVKKDRIITIVIIVIVIIVINNTFLFHCISLFISIHFIYFIWYYLHFIFFVLFFFERFTLSHYISVFSSSSLLSIYISLFFLLLIFHFFYINTTFHSSHSFHSFHLLHLMPMWCLCREKVMCGWLTQWTVEKELLNFWIQWQMRRNLYQKYLLSIR